MELYQSLNVNSKNVGKKACETREIQFYCAALLGFWKSWLVGWSD